VRGKTVGHLFLYHVECVEVERVEVERIEVEQEKPEVIRMIGSIGQSQTVADHIERYTIREDATAVIRDNEFRCIALSDQAAKMVDQMTEPGGVLGADDPISVRSGVQINGIDVDVYRTSWLGEQTTILLVSAENENAVSRTLQELSISKGTVEDFHCCRVEAGFPWYGIDIDKSNLPQELDRDSAAISFTKGCYLGQETVARLDAIGQVQRKLVRWSIQGTIPHPGETLSVGPKTVGRLTSIAKLATGETLALGFARRTHFEAGSSAAGGDGGEFTGTVL